jgi:hypothetical protein
MSFDLDQPLEDLVIDVTPESEIETAGAQPRRTVLFRLDLPATAPLPQGELTATYLSNEGNILQQKRERLPIEGREMRLEVPVPTKVGVRTDGLVGYWLKEMWGEKVEPGEAPHVITLSPIPAGAIYGGVLEPDGSPAADAMITVVVVERSTRMPPGSLDVRVKNSSGGPGDTITKFMASPLPLGGTYAIVLHSEERYAVSEPIVLNETSPMREIELRFARGATVSGQILQPNGQPAGGVQFRFGYSTPYSHGFGGADRWTDREGRFTFEQVNRDVPGDYSISIAGNPGMRPTVVKFQPEDSPLTIRLETGRVVAGRVVDAETRLPVEGAEVYALPRGDGPREPTGYLDADLKTNAQGEFRFTTMAARDYSLNVRGARTVPLSRETMVTGGQVDPVTLRVEIREGSPLKPRKPGSTTGPPRKIEW